MYLTGRPTVGHVYITSFAGSRHEGQDWFKQQITTCIRQGRRTVEHVYITVTGGSRDGPVYLKQQTTTGIRQGPTTVGNT